MNRTLSICGIVLLVGTAYLFGRGADYLAAQDRKGPPTITPPPRTTTPTKAPEVLVYGQEGGGSASANGILAVTGSYGVGTSVLYVIDTNTKQLAVYEARGGSKSMRRVQLVGARRIDLDLQLEGYNDESEFDYRQLRDMFAGSRAPGGARDDKAGAGDGR